MADTSSQLIVPEVNTEEDIIPGSQVLNSSLPPMNAATSNEGLSSLSQGVKRERERTRGMVLKGDTSKKLIEAQEATASALNIVAAAIEKDIDTRVKLLQIETKKLELESRKVAAFDQIVLHFLEHYP